MAKKKTKKLKFVSDDKMEEYQNMSESELVASIKSQHAHIESAENKKKSSEFLKEARSEISEYRKTWSDENPEKVEEIEDLKAGLKVIKDERDAKIEQDLEEKKDLESGFNDNINGAKEHLMCMAFCLRFHQ